MRGEFHASEPGPLVVVNEKGVARHCDDGFIEEVRWDELRQISVLTTSADPFAEDVFFELVGENGTGMPRSSRGGRVRPTP
jgi:hypothetical protein